MRSPFNGVAIFAAWESANIRVTMWNFRSHFRGKYRFRISGYGFQSEGKPVNFKVTAGVHPSSGLPPPLPLPSSDEGRGPG